MRNGRRKAFVNARLLDPAAGLDRRGAVLVDGHMIADCGPTLFADGVPEGIEVIDCAGQCLAPGLIDMRVFIGEPGAEHKETLATASAAAAAGGVTTIAMMPETNPVIDDVALVEFVARQARDKAVVSILPTAAITKGLAGREMTEMGLLQAGGAVALSDGSHALADALVMRRVLSYASSLDMLIMQHAAEPSLSGNGCMNEGEVATRLGLPGIPAAAEAIMVERDIRLVELTGARYHVASVSTAAALAAIRAAKRRGLPVSCATSPTHFALNENAVGSYRTFAKLSPPLRGEDDRRAVVEALADGTIDAIASSHMPQDQESKRLPFEQAEDGAVGLETLLPVGLELVHNRRLTLSEFLARVVTRPAELLGLRRGSLKAGTPADLVVFDPDMPWVVDADALRSKSKNTPFDGRPVQGRATVTVVGGNVVHRLTGA